MKYKIVESAEFLAEKIENENRIAMVLGSGLGFLADKVEDAVKVCYEEIPHFKKSTVKGHEGVLICGELAGKRVILMKGRYHFYEGHTMEEVTFPIRVLKEIGVKTLILTNAAGGINPFFEVGDLMMLNDHINFGINPLIGSSENLGDRFPSLDGLYSKRLARIARRIAEDKNIPLREGVYLFTSGPSYETKAEIRMFHKLGADAVGMSTVPEAIVARHAGIDEVAAISLITNRTLGNYVPTHEEVIETGKKSREYFAELVLDILKQI